MAELLNKKEEAEIEAEAKIRLAIKLFDINMLWSIRNHRGDLDIRYVSMGVKAIISKLARKGIVYEYPRSMPGMAPMPLSLIKLGLIKLINSARKEGKL